MIKKNIKIFLLKLLHLIIVQYIICVFIFVPYFNWKYAKQNGFISWVMLGEVVSTFKGVFFPYFLIKDLSTPKPITNLTQEQTTALKSFYLAMETSQEGTKLGNSEGFGIVTSEEMQKELSFDKKAVSIGKEIDTDVLNSIYSDLGKNFKDMFIYGTSLYIEGVEVGDSSKILKGSSEKDSFIDWINKNRYSIPRIEK